MDEDQERHLHIVRMMEEVSFRIEFIVGVNAACITEAHGWIAKEIGVSEGTYQEICAEAHRLVNAAVAAGRCSKHANRAAGGERKRDITIAAKYAKSLSPRTRRRTRQG